MNLIFCDCFCCWFSVRIRKHEGNVGTWEISPFFNQTVTSSGVVQCHFNKSNLFEHNILLFQSFNYLRTLTFEWGVIVTKCLFYLLNTLFLPLKYLYIWSLFVLLHHSISVSPVWISLTFTLYVYYNFFPEIIDLFNILLLNVEECYGVIIDSPNDFVIYSYVNYCL